MKRSIIAGLSVFAAVATVSWKLASVPEGAVALTDVSLIQGSEVSHRSPTNDLAGIRIRLSPSDFGHEITASADVVPQVTLAAE